MLYLLRTRQHLQNFTYTDKLNFVDVKSCIWVMLKFIDGKLFPNTMYIITVCFAYI